LETRDLDGDGGIGSEGVDLVLGDHRVEEDDAHDDERQDGVDDLDYMIRVELPGHPVRVAAAIGDDRPEDETPHQHRDSETGNRHPGPQLELVLGLGRGTPEATEGRQRAAPEAQREGDERGERRDALQLACRAGPHGPRH